MTSQRTRFFNLLRSVLKLLHLEGFLALFTKGKGYDNFFVRCLPQNHQYKKGTFRIVRRNGIRYILDLSEYMEWVIYFSLGVEERSSLFDLVKKDMVILDVGTNVGETLLNFARLTGTNGMVYGFEPVNENYEKCRRNISLNAFMNISVSQKALSDKTETLYFAPSVNNNSGGIFMNKENGSNEHSASAITLDDFISEKKINRVDLIKIDVEGFEYHVLKGAIQTVSRFRPLLFIEIDEYNLRRQGAGAGMILEVLREHGYQFNKAGGEAVLENDGHYDLVCTYKS